MKNFTCIIVDDEPLARELLATHIKKVPFLELVSACKNAFEARLALQEHQPDLLFIDIEMPELTGLELLKMLPKMPATILTTAYKEHALAAFELGAMDYLLKPIEFDRFFKSISKIIDWLGHRTSDLAPLSNAPSVQVQANHIFVKSNGRLVKLMVEDLLFVEALEKYVRLHLPHERIVTAMSMSQTLEMLPESRFYRVHRSFIVNLTKVESIEGNLLRIGKTEIPIGKGHRETVLARVL